MLLVTNQNRDKSIHSPCIDIDNVQLSLKEQKTIANKNSRQLRRT